MYNLLYVGKIETAFNRRINNNWKESKKKDPILAYTRFQKSNYIFQQDVKSILIELIPKKYNILVEHRFILKKRDKSRFNGLNQERNDVW